MILSPHIECAKVFHMILMWNDKERDHIRMWCPNERWEDLTFSRPSLWTWGEAQREWVRATRNLFQYQDHTVIELCVLHTPCGLMEHLRKLQIERSGV